MAATREKEALERYLGQRTKEGALYETLDNQAVRCYACGHRCKIPEGYAGVCKVRYNDQGTLKVPHGYVAGMNCDPIEKKPFFHAIPGSLTMSFGMVGCDYHCSFCQNWVSSQVLRDPRAKASVRDISAREIVDLALHYGGKAVTSTYNEPLITSEWAVDIFKLAKQAGLITSYVSNGNATPEVLDYLRPHVDMYKVDLKAFRDKSYRKLGGTLERVTDSIQGIWERGFWMELVTLVVPGMNDAEEELRDMAKFIASIDVRIPWHLTAFYETYKMHGPGATPLETLISAGEIAKEEGLHYVYIGNVHGYAPEWENTYCPSCQALLIDRHGYRIRKNEIQQGTCKECGQEIPGVWNT